MFEVIKFHQRILTAAVLAVAASGAVCAPASAQPIETPSVQADSMSVVRDPLTGELRAPTADELAALQPKSLARVQSLRVAPKPTLQKYHPNGARGVRLTDEFTSSVVAVRNADGSIGHQCVEGHAGEHAAHAAALVPAAKAAPQSVTE